MKRENGSWAIRQGDPARLGTYRTADGYNFAIQTEKRGNLELVFYKKGSPEEVRRIAVPDAYRVGDRYAAAVKKTGLSLYTYGYLLDGEPLEDPAARWVEENRGFGEKAEADSPVHQGLLREEALKPNPVRIPYEEMILYKVHVRGYTMQKNSGVRKKGTFAGLQEKIGYWKDLGITSLELMPAYDFLEYPKQPDARGEMPKSYRKYEDVQPDRLNYWGYTSGRYYAPKAAYCRSNQPEHEMKELIRQLHQAGIECLMDFYFPGETDPQLVADVLRFWRMEYGIDGFVLLGEGVWAELLARDGVLKDTKLLCPGWDMQRIRQFEKQGFRRLADYHPGFQNAMRQVLKGDEDQINHLFYYTRENPVDHGVVHYMANHDGFTLADLVSYDVRHNEKNGEENRDGTSYNYSWNCGAEGPTRKSLVNRLRRQQMRNAVLLLFLSQGTPLLYGGDEAGNSQEGNNNSYCQDNAIGWVDWSKAKRFAGFTEFIKQVIAFRKEHPILHMPWELRPTDYRSLEWPELSYHSERAWFADRSNTSRQAGILYCGGYAKEVREEGDVFLYVTYNMHWTEQRLALPDLPDGQNWYLVIDSSREDKEAVDQRGGERIAASEKYVTVKPRTIMVFTGKQGDRI